MSASVNGYLWWTGRQISSGGDFSLSTWLALLLTAGDAGALNVLSANFLRSCGFISLLCVSVLPGAWPVHLKSVYGGLALFLLGGLLSVAWGAVPYDGFVAWSNWAAAGCAFTAGSVLAYRSNDSAVMRKILSALAVSCLVTVLWAWVMFEGAHDVRQSMYGVFYNQNLLAGWLLLLWPLSCLAVCRASKESIRSAPAWLGVLFCSITAVTLFFTYNRTAWAIGLFLMLLSGTGLDSAGTWKQLCLRIAACAGAVAALTAAAVLACRGCISASAGCAAVLLSLLCLLFKNSSLRQKRCVWLYLSVCILLSFALTVKLGWHTGWGAPRAKARIQQLAQGGDSSGLARLAFFKAAWKISLDYPWLGAGPQGFSRFYPRYQEDARWFSRYSHCFVLDLLCEYGWPNTVVLLFCIGYAAWLALTMWRQDSGEGSLWRLGLILGLAGLGLHAQADVDMHFAALPLTAAILCGAMLGTPVSQWTFADEETSASPYSIRTSLLRQYVLALMTLCCLGLNAQSAAADYYGTLARYCQDNRRYEEALAYYRDASDNCPLNSDYRCRLVQVMLRLNLQGREENCSQELEENSLAAVENDPCRALCYEIRGQTLEALGRRQEAIIQYKRALSLDPCNLPGAYFDTARVFVHSGNPEAANLCLESALRRVTAPVLLSGLDSPFQDRTEALTVYEVFLNHIPVQEGWRWEAVKVLEDNGADGTFITYVRGAAYLDLARWEREHGNRRQMLVWLSAAEEALREVKNTKGSYRGTERLLADVCQMKE